MEQNHPIPQQISSYQFRLVGDMTLKQFFEIAGGVVVGLVFYATPLPGYIKWPIIIFAVLLGGAMAFIPFEERPLEKWIFAFFRSVYSPTLFSWNKAETQKVYYQNETVPQPAQNIIAPQGVEALNNYLATPTTSTSFFTKLEAGEKGFLTRVGDLFGPGSPNKGVVSVSPVLENTPAQTQTANLSSQTVNFAPAPTVNSTGNITVDNPEPVVATSTPQRPKLEIPVTNPVSIPHTEKPKYIVEEAVTPAPAVPTQVTPNPTGTNPSAQAAVFSPDAAPPNPPSIPNTVSGQVIDPKGGIVEGAILEIRDISGRPVRALKSNKLGHFYIVTPLVAGSYEIITEKDGLEFTPVKFEAEGSIINPIAIRAVREIADLPLENTSATQAFSPAI